MLKKIIITVLCLVSGAVNVCAFNDIYDVNTGTAVESLVQYGIINGYEDGTFRPDNNITRAEFAKIIIAAGNLFCLVENETVFSDTELHWARDYIAIARYLGIVNGMTADTFAPDGWITNEQAVKMIVCSLGYGEEAAAAGGYPNGHIKIGKELGVLKNLEVSNTAYATRGDIAVMVDNALGIPYKIVDENGAILINKTFRDIHEDLLVADEYTEADPVGIEPGEDIESVG